MLVKMEPPFKERRIGRGCSLKASAYAFAIYLLIEWSIMLICGLISFGTGESPISFLPPSSRLIKRKKLYPYIAVVLSIIGLLFTTLLIIGLKKRKPALLMTYFVYGIVNKFIGLASFAYLIFRFAIQGHLHQVRPIFWLLVLHVLTIAGLVVVIKIYNRFIVEKASQFTHKNIKEDTTHTV